MPRGFSMIVNGISQGLRMNLSRIKVRYGCCVPLIAWTIPPNRVMVSPLFVVIPPRTTWFRQPSRTAAQFIQHQFLQDRLCESGEAGPVEQSILPRPVGEQGHPLQCVFLWKWKSLGGWRRLGLTLATA